MAGVDDEESSGDEESSADEEEGADLGEEGQVDGGEMQAEEFPEDDGIAAGIPEDWSPFIEMPQSPDPPATMPKFNLFPANWTEVPQDQDERWMCFTLLIIGLLLLWNALIWEAHS